MHKKWVDPVYWKNMRQKAEEQVVATENVIAAAMEVWYRVDDGERLHVNSTCIQDLATALGIWDDLVHPYQWSHRCER